MSNCCAPDDNPSVQMLRHSYTWLVSAEYAYTNWRKQRMGNTVAFQSFWCSLCILNPWKIGGECRQHMLDVRALRFPMMCIAYLLAVICNGEYFSFAIMPFIIQPCWYSIHNVQEFGHEIVCHTAECVCVCVRLRDAECTIHLRRRRSAVYSVCCISNSAFE